VWKLRIYTGDSILSSEINEKRDRVVEYLDQQNLAAVLLGSQHNFAWITAGANNGIDLTREAGSAWVLITPEKLYLLANNIEMSRLLAEEVGEKSFEPVEFDWVADKTDPEFLIKKARSLVGSSKEIGYDLPSAAFRYIDGSFSSLRYSLTADEVARYREWGADLGRAIGDLVKELKPGQTESEIARLANNAVLSCNGRPVVTLVAADERIGQYRHPVPGCKRWEKLLMVVVGARRHGLSVSLSRIICNGEIPSEIHERTVANAEVNAFILSETRLGAVASDIFSSIVIAYREAGFEGEERLHHQGGACGYRSRDWVAHPNSDEIVQKWQAFAWNPSITGTKVEETCIATPDGVEIISASPRWPLIRTKVGDLEYSSPDILSL
jgi:Xaa-Pro dipeptidase